MKPPRTIRTLGGVLVVRTTGALDEDCGNYDAGRAEIHISNQLAPDVERITLIHELTHDVLFRTGVENGMEKDDRERICDGIAVGFYELIRSNPSLIEYLTSKS